LHSFGHIPRVVWKFLRNFILFSIVVALVYIPTSSG
jgi:hypothetical protein